jgi:hypothetical protein
VAILSGAEAAGTWARVPEASRTSYGSIPEPGQPIESALAHTKNIDPRAFAVLRLQVLTIDALLRGPEHRRARFDRRMAGKGSGSRRYARSLWQLPVVPRKKATGCFVYRWDPRRAWQAPTASAAALEVSCIVFDAGASLHRRLASRHACRRLDLLGQQPMKCYGRQREKFFLSSPRFKPTPSVAKSGARFGRPP